MFGYGFLAVVLVLYLDASGLDPLGDRRRADADARRRRRHLAVADDARRPVRPSPGARRQQPADARRRGGVRGDGLASAAHRGRHRRRHLADRQRGRPVPRRRAGGAHRGRPGPAPDRDLRLVQPRRLRRDGDRGACRGPRRPGADLGGLASRSTPTGSIVVGYAAIGLAMAVIASRLGPAIEVAEPATADGIARRLGLGRSRSVVFRLAALFSLDAFAGGFVPLSLMAFWFTLRFGVEPGDARGDLLRLEPAVRGVGAVGRTDRRQVRAHQHDGVHPPAVERPADARPADADAAACDRRPAAPVQPQPDGRADPPVVRDGGGRSRRAVGGGRGDRASPGPSAPPISPSISTVLVAGAATAALPFYLAGGLKILYDLLIYRDFRAVRPAGGGGRLARLVGLGPRSPARLDDAEPDPGERDDGQQRDDRVLEPLEDRRRPLPSSPRARRRRTRAAR